MLKNHFSFRPLLAERYYSREAAKKIEAIVNQENIDVILAETLLMSRYLNHAKGVFCIIDEHNLEFIRAESRVAATNFILKKIYFSLIKWRLKRYELKELAGYDLCFVCSRNDEKILKAQGLTTPLKVVPNAIDTNYFQPSALKKEKKGGQQIVFLGTMWYEPNADAVQYFTTKIFPGLKSDFPELRLVVVGEGRKHFSALSGKNCSLKQLQLLKNEKRKGDFNLSTVRVKTSFPDINFTGYVEDIRPYLRESAVFIVPLRMGSGTRIKILTAMAMGVPVVSSSIGCEGLEVSDGKNILVADTSEEFREKVKALLNNPQLREKIGNEGRKLVEQKYYREAVITELRLFWSQLETSFRDSN